MNSITAVWGSPGAGKTTVALGLGAAWAKRKEDTLILSTDTCVPALPLYLPRDTSVTSAHSISSLLEMDTITEGGLKGRIHRHPKSDHLFFMGYASGELASISFTPPRRDSIVALLQLLQKTPFRHIIVDCMSNPIYDALTLFALEHTAVVRVLTPDVKGYEFQKSKLTWLNAGGDLFKTDRHTKVGNPFFPYSARKEAEALFGGFDYELPFSVQVSEHMTAGELLTGFNDTAGVAFERLVSNLSEKLVDMEVMENEKPSDS